MTFSTSYRFSGGLWRLRVLFCSVLFSLQLLLPIMWLGPELNAEEGLTQQDITRIEALADKCPPPYQADSLLRLTERLPDSPPETVKRLVEKAFREAEQVPVPYPMAPVPIGFTDTVPAMDAISSRDMLVDRFSLRLRAAWRMLRVDPVRARQMFEEVSQPTLPASTCNSFEVPDTHWYFDLARDLSEKAFSAEDVQRGETEAFLRKRLQGISSPLEVFPAIGLLAEAQIPAQSRQRLVDLLSSAIERINGDDRSYTVSLLEEGARNVTSSFISQSLPDKVSTAPLLRALQHYHLRHLQAPRCADMLKPEPLQIREKAAIHQVNLLLLQAGVSTVPESAKPSALLPTGKSTDLYEASPEYQSFRKALFTLKPRREDAAKEWGRMISAVDSWSGGRLEPEGVFILKSQLLYRVLEFTNDPGAFREASRVYCRFIENSTLERDREPAVWLHYLWNAMKVVSRRGPSWEETLFGEMQKGKVPAVVLYAEWGRKEL